MKSLLIRMTEDHGLVKADTIHKVRAERKDSYIIRRYTDKYEVEYILTEVPKSKTKIYWKRG